MFKINRGKNVSTVKSVPLSAIDFENTKFRFRLEIPEAHLRNMMKSISEQGLQNLPKLRVQGDRYQIIAGWTRIQAVKKLGRSEVVAEVFENLSDREAMLISSSDNLHRVNLSDLELSNHLHALRRDYKIPAKTIVEWLRGREQRYNDLLKLQIMDDSLRVAVHKGKLTLYGAVELHKFPERARTAYVGRAIREQWSVRKIKKERNLLHPFFGLYSEEERRASKGLYHALKYVRYPETDGVETKAWEHIYKGFGVPAPHKCEVTMMIRARDNDPPYVCNNDIEWVVVARGRLEPYGNDMENTTDNLQEWFAWGHLCTECTELVYPSIEYHEDIPFIIPLMNLRQFKVENTLNV
jgi:ParB-like chromosome segregation protein Spo0J